MKRKRSSQREYIQGLSKRTSLGLSILLTVLCVLSLLPFVLIASVSFSSERSIVNSGYRFLPEEWSLSAYQYLFAHGKNLFFSFGVTVFITAAGTVLSLLLISTMAYALSQKDFRFNVLFTLVVVIPMFFGGGLAASYTVNTQLYGLKNTIWALILPPACSGWYIMVMRTYLKSNISPEILEAARLDGASTFCVFWRFVMPLSKPILIPIGIFEAFAYWNSWYENLLYTDSNHSKLFTLQYVLYNLEKNASFLSSSERVSGMTSVQIPTESFRMALTVAIILPILVIYFLFRRHLERGVKI